MKLTEGMMDEAVRNAYLWGHGHCRYGPTDRSYPVGDDGIMDCAGLVLRALYTLGLVSGPLNIDQLDAVLPSLGFVKSEDIRDVYRHHGVAMWCEPHNAGTVHVNHVYYSLGGDWQTISKYDTGSDARLSDLQPYCGFPADEWGGRYVFKWIWYLPEEDSGIYLKVGD